MCSGILIPNIVTQRKDSQTALLMREEKEAKTDSSDSEDEEDEDDALHGSGEDDDEGEHDISDNLNEREGTSQDSGILTQEPLMVAAIEVDDCVGNVCNDFVTMSQQNQVVPCASSV